jgi:hypothetical protein
MKYLLFAITILSILSSCDPGSKKPAPAPITLIGTWVLDSLYVRDTVSGIASYADSIQPPSTASVVTFSSNGIATSIDPAYTIYGQYNPADTTVSDYYVSNDTLYSRAIGCNCNYAPYSTYTISNNQLIETIKNSFNPTLGHNFEMSYNTRK